MKKRFLSVLLTLAMLFQLLPVSAFAAEPTDTPSVVKSALSDFYPTSNTYNCVSGNWAETGYGRVNLPNAGDTVTDIAFCHYYGNHYTGSPKGYTNLTVFSSNSDIVTATAESTEQGIKVTFTKGQSTGSATVTVGYTVTELRVDSGIAVDSDTAYAVSGRLVYNVSGGSSEEYSKEDVWSIKIDLDSQQADVYKNGTWSGTPAKTLNVSNNAYSFSYEPFITNSYYGSLYPDSITNISTGDYDSSIALIGVTPAEWEDDRDAIGVTAKGLIYRITGLKPGKTTIEGIYSADVCVRIDNMYAYYDEETVKHTLNVWVVQDSIETITLTYQDTALNLQATDSKDVNIGESATFTAKGPLGSRPGYTFMGWAESENADSAKYNADEQITISENTTLYAVWKKVESTNWDGLTITKTLETEDTQDGKVQPGETVTYTITVTNNTGKDLTNIKVADVLDNNLTFVSADPEGTHDNDTDTVEWTIPKLENEGSAKLKVTATVATNAQDKTEIPNTASITEADEKKFEDKESDPVTVTVEVPAPGPGPDEPDKGEVTIEKEADKKTAKPGETVTFTITVKNGTDKDLTNVKVTDVLDENLSFAKDEKDEDPSIFYDEPIHTWTKTIDKLSAGEQVEIKIEAAVSQDAKADASITNTASIAIGDDEEVSNPVTVTVTDDGNEPGDDDGNEPGDDDGNEPGDDDGNEPGGDDGNEGGDTPDTPDTPSDPGTSGGSGDDGSWVLPALAVGAAVAVPVIIHHFKNQTPAVPAEGVEEVPPVVVEEEIPVVPDEVVEAQPVPKTGDATHPIALALGGAAMLALGGALGRKRREDDGDGEQ